MITLTNKQVCSIMGSVNWDGDIDDAITSTINATIDELNRNDRLTPPEPASHPRTATMTLLDDGSHLLVIQNGDCIAAVTLTAAQVIAWEFREASK